LLWRKGCNFPQPISISSGFQDGNKTPDFPAATISPKYQEQRLSPTPLEYFGTDGSAHATPDCFREAFSEEMFWNPFDSAIWHTQDVHQSTPGELT